MPTSCTNLNLYKAKFGLLLVVITVSMMIESYPHLKFHF